MKSESGIHVINISTFNTVSQALGVREKKKKQKLFCREIKSETQQQIMYTACSPIQSTYRPD